MTGHVLMNVNKWKQQILLLSIELSQCNHPNTIVDKIGKVQSHLSI